MRKPTIDRGPASMHAGPAETIRELHWPGDGAARSAAGGLIALRRDAEGRPVVELYRLDPGVRVLLAPEHLHRTARDEKGAMIRAARAARKAVHRGA